MDNEIYFPVPLRELYRLIDAQNEILEVLTTLALTKNAIVPILQNRQGKSEADYFATIDTLDLF